MLPSRVTRPAVWPGSPSQHPGPRRAQTCQVLMHCTGLAYLTRDLTGLPAYNSPRNARCSSAPRPVRSRLTHTLRSSRTQDLTGLPVYSSPRNARPSGAPDLSGLDAPYLSHIPNARPDRSAGLRLAPKRPAQRRAEQLLRLAQRLALLDSGDVRVSARSGEFLLN